MTGSRKHLYVALLALGIVLLFLFATTGLPPKGRMMPQIVGIIGLVLCILDVIAQTDTAFGRSVASLLSGTAHREEEEDRAPLGSELIAMAWIAGATAGIILFGFLWATPVYVVAYMLIQGRKPVLQSLIAAAVTTLFIWGVFEKLMEYEVFRGVLFTDL